MLREKEIFKQAILASREAVNARKRLDAGIEELNDVTFHVVEQRDEFIIITFPFFSSHVLKDEIVSRQFYWLLVDKTAIREKPCLFQLRDKSPLVEERNFIIGGQINLEKENLLSLLEEKYGGKYKVLSFWKTTPWQRLDSRTDSYYSSKEVREELNYHLNNVISYFKTVEKNFIAAIEKRKGIYYEYQWYVPIDIQLEYPEGFTGKYLCLNEKLYVSVGRLNPYRKDIEDAIKKSVKEAEKEHTLVECIHHKGEEVSIMIPLCFINLNDKVTDNIFLIKGIYKGGFITPMGKIYLSLLLAQG